MGFAAISNFASDAEPLFWLMALAAFLRFKNHSRFTSLGVFLGIRAVSAIGHVGMLNSAAFAAATRGYWGEADSFYLYGVTYLLGSVAFFLALQEILRAILSRLPGLVMLGDLGFRWIASVSLLLAVSSSIPFFFGTSLAGHVSILFREIARSLCLLELSVLLLLVLSMRTLGLTFKNRAVGLSLGFGLLAAMDFVVFSFSAAQASPTFSLISTLVTMAALVIWAFYLTIPEPAEAPAMALAPSSPLLRWNDLALNLGQSEEQAEGQSGFLHDVESVVERVLAKNSLSNT
jgi:hypothetical protein